MFSNRAPPLVARTAGREVRHMTVTHTSSLLESFVTDEKTTELELVDDLWYLVVGSHGRVIVGSG